jgi:hypothetical protein
MLTFLRLRAANSLGNSYPFEDKIVENGALVITEIGVELCGN